MKKLVLVLFVLLASSAAFAKGNYSGDVNLRGGLHLLTATQVSQTNAAFGLDLATTHLWGKKDNLKFGFTGSLGIGRFFNFLIGPTVGIKCGEIVRFDISPKVGFGLGAIVGAIEGGEYNEVVAILGPFALEADVKAKFFPNKFVNPIASYGFVFTGGGIINKFEAGVALSW